MYEGTKGPLQAVTSFKALRWGKENGGQENGLLEIKTKQNKTFFLLSGPTDVIAGHQSMSLRHPCGEALLTTHNPRQINGPSPSDSTLAFSSLFPIPLLPPQVGQPGDHPTPIPHTNSFQIFRLPLALTVFCPVLMPKATRKGSHSGFPFHTHGLQRIHLRGLC